MESGSESRSASVNVNKSLHGLPREGGLATTLRFEIHSANQYVGWFRALNFEICPLTLNIYSAIGLANS